MEEGGVDSLVVFSGRGLKINSPWEQRHFSYRSDNIPHSLGSTQDIDQNETFSLPSCVYMCVWKCFKIRLLANIDVVNVPVACGAGEEVRGLTEWRR